MKANELMIGDWVVWQHAIENKYHGIYQVAVIEEGWIDFYGEEGHCCSQPFNEIHPIPLTADILNKNFPDTRYNVFWCWDDRKEGNELWFEIRIEGEDMEFRMDMRYVHELQHALRLCGIEKEIEL